MGKKEFIKSVKQYSDDYVSSDSFKNDKWEHYSDETWGNIYDLGNVYHTDQVIVKGKYSETSKLSADNDWFFNWVKKQFEEATRHGVEIELHILGAIIQKECAVTNNQFVFADGGWIRYIKIKK